MTTVAAQPAASSHSQDILYGLAAQAARVAEVDRERTAVLAAVGHDLAGNALRYSRAAAPPLLTAWTAGNQVELRVVDHGPGIPAADRKRVFQPFCRLGDPRDRTGVGLGLAVARSLAETMGGTVEPEDTAGGGLTMVFTLPAAPAEARGARRIRVA